MLIKGEMVTGDLTIDSYLTKFIKKGIQSMMNEIKNN